MLQCGLDAKKTCQKFQIESQALQIKSQVFQIELLRK